MIPTEKQIISRMENLLDFEFREGKTNEDDIIAWIINVRNILNSILPLKNSLLKLVEGVLDECLSEEYFEAIEIDEVYTKCRGILKAVHSDFQSGFLKDLRTEIRAEVDADFLSQAERLLDENIKDSAAMLIGAILEDTLRQLCKKCGVQEEQNIESMNASLRKAKVYTLPVQQQVTAWASIRNKADHARFDEYDLQQVKLMHQGVTDFIVKYVS